MTRAREDARRRQAKNPEWDFRLIVKESGAAKLAEDGSRLFRGQLVGAGSDVIEAV